MEYKQDLPPSGGYASITYERVPIKSFFKPKLMLACLMGASAFNWYLYDKFRRKENIERIEMRCANQAIVPMVLAETDRMLLKQLKKNRDMEEEVMKDVKGWEVGKWKHCPVYLSIDPDEFFKPHFAEFYAHTDMKNLEMIVNLFAWT